MVDLLLIILLILLNGVFSMSEVALISVRKSKLASEAKDGSRSAARVLSLVSEPDRFLSTVQIGITLIGILTGLFSGATVANEFARILISWGVASSVSLLVSKVLIVTLVTYLSIVVGELVPKRIGLGRADIIAKLVSGPMKLLSTLAYPAVKLLSVSTSCLVRLLRVGDDGSKVTEEEIKTLIRDGADAGEVQEMEQDIMERALVLGDLRIEAIMTARKDVDYLAIDMDGEKVREVVSENLHYTYPVFDEERKDICGVVSLKRLMLVLGTRGFCLAKELTEGLSLPETMTVYDALVTFRETKVHSALIYDEYGVFRGILTLRDVLEGLVGSLPQEVDTPLIEKTGKDGEWLVDGQCPVYDFLEHFDREDLYEPAPYTTLGGMLIDGLRKVPEKGDSLDWHGFHIEVETMDRARIDKLRVSFCETA